MNQKKKYYLIGFLVLAVLIIGYHFLAASQAEDQIDEAIQEQTAKLENIFAKYSSIDISPFSGDVSISDLNFIFGNHIERAQHIQLDIDYMDFLNIYFGGIIYGLENLDEAKITLIQPSYVNKSGLEEMKSDTIQITYRGNALDGIRSTVNGTAFKFAQHIDAASSGLRLRLPNTAISQITAKKITYSGTISEGKQHFWTNGSHQFKLDVITWTPSESFQNAYSFFIKGFGYETDAIPLESAQLHSNPGSQPNSLHIEAAIKSELAQLSGSGFLYLEEPPVNSKLQDMVISITDFSDVFSRVLQNLERLLSVKLPRNDAGINFKITGTLANPEIAR